MHVRDAAVMNDGTQAPPLAQPMPAPDSSQQAPDAGKDSTVSHAFDSAVGGQPEARSSDPATVSASLRSSLGNGQVPRRDFRPPHDLKAKRGGAAISGDMPSQRFVEPDYERLRALAALYDNQTRKARRSMYRLVLTLLTFIVGASAGVGGAWWMANSGGTPATSTRSASPFPSFKLDEQAAVAARKGINAGELPYDGGNAPANRIPAAPVVQSNPEELPYGGLSSGSNGMAVDEGGEGTGIPAPAQKRTTPSHHTTANPSAMAAERNDDKSDAKAQATQRKTVKASQQHRSGQRHAKDREIERIRRQADDELKKKPERRRAIGEARSRSRSSGNRLTGRERTSNESGASARTRALLARCERATSLIQREQCKWQLCNGMWGKNGCPSYAHANPY